MISLLDTLACWGLRVLARFFSVFSPAAAMRWGRFLGYLAFCFSGRRHVAYADLKNALGPAFTEKERRKIVVEHYVHLGQMFVEILRFQKLDRQAADRTIRLRDEELLVKTFGENKGGIFLTAHFGNWEILQVIPPRQFSQPLHVLARNQKFPKLNSFLNAQRESLGTVVSQRGIEVRDLLRSLRRKEWIALLGDQDAGKTGGVILPFFGRKTTVPTGAFELASRTGVPIIPSFVVRREEVFHDVYLPEVIRCKEGAVEDIENGAKSYIRHLEDFIRRHPSHWLWETKRWKYTWTKRLLILSDGKPGHLKQSEAIAEQFQGIDTQYGRPGMEYPLTTVTIHYKSKLHRKLFTLFSLLFIPFAQGRLRFLKFFFTPESHKAIEESQADFVISAGSGLVPLNLCMARDLRAKSIVVMKPSFPFHFFRYDLAVVPAHDTGMMPGEAFRTLLAPSSMEPDAMEKAAQKIAPGLRNAKAVKFSIFLGGATRRFQLGVEDARSLFSVMDRLSPVLGDYLVTTSRRTSVEVSDFLKQSCRNESHCQMLVVAKEDTRPEVVSAMMYLADILIVTEDSISMISEAIRSGKKVIVLGFGSPNLPSKHKRFREILSRESAVVLATPEDLEEKIALVRESRRPAVAQTEAEALKRRLQEIL